MTKYAFEIIETLSHIVYVEADSQEEAHDKVIDDYRHQRIVLDAEHVIDTEILCFDEYLEED